MMMIMIIMMIMILIILMIMMVNMMMMIVIMVTQHIPTRWESDIMVKDGNMRQSNSHKFP